MIRFLYGLLPTVEDSCFKSIDQLSSSVGGNTGNLAFCHALAGHLKRPPVVGWGDFRQDLFTRDAVGVLALANQLGPHANMGFFADLLRKHDAKLVGIGLGAQSPLNSEDVNIPDGSIEWVKLIQERSPSDSPNISVRGPFTKKILDKYGLAEKVEVLGCPTLFINPDGKLGEKIKYNSKKRRLKIAVSAGHPDWEWLKGIERDLISNLNGYGDYITQSCVNMISLGRGCSLNHEISMAWMNKCKEYLGFSNVETFATWGAQHAVSFFSASAWMEHLSHFDFVIGTRIHGVMLALQVGVPALCIVHDSRTKELCDVMGVPYIEVFEFKTGADVRHIIDGYEFDAELFDSNRAELAKRYSCFLSNNLIEPPEWLIRL